MSDQSQIAALVGALLSLLFYFTPGLSTWFDTLSATRKAVFIIVLTIIAGVFVFLSNQPSDVLQHLTWLDVRHLAEDIVAALFTSQLNHYFVNRPLAPAKGQ